MRWLSSLFTFSSADCELQLEVDPSGDLHVPWAIVDCAGHTESDRLRGVARLLIGKTHAMPIEDVKGFALQLEGQPLSQAEVL